MKKIVAFTVLFSFFPSLLTITGNAAEVLVWVGGTSFSGWTSANGKYQTTAKLVDVSEDGKIITLLKKDGKEVTVTLEQLSKESQAVVQKRRARLIGFRNSNTVILSNGVEFEWPFAGLTRGSQGQESVVAAKRQWEKSEAERKAKSEAERREWEERKKQEAAAKAERERQEATAKAERERKEREAATKAEQERKEREEAAKVERERMQREAASRAERKPKGLSAINSNNVEELQKELEGLDIEHIRNKAEQGYSDAQYLLGLRYCMVENNMQGGIRWIRKAGESGFTEAQTWLAQYYSQGPQKNVAEASYWSKKAGEGLGNLVSKTLLFTLAEKGDRGAAHVIASRYQEGTDGFEKDEREAVKWFLRAAELGHPDAQAIIGICYITGHYVAQNRDTGIYWIRKAIANGNQTAKDLLKQIEN